jgi:hypothetical protein
VKRRQTSKNFPAASIGGLPKIVGSLRSSNNVVAQASCLCVDLAGVNDLKNSQAGCLCHYCRLNSKRTGTTISDSSASGPIRAGSNSQLRTACAAALSSREKPEDFLI